MKLGYRRPDRHPIHAADVVAITVMGLVLLGALIGLGYAVFTR